MLANLPRIVEHFVRDGRFTTEEATTLVELASEQGRHLREVLLESNALSAREYREAAAHLYGIDAIDLSQVTITTEAVEKVSARLVHSYRFMPVELQGEALVIALSDPEDLRLQDDLARILKFPLELRLAEPAAIDAAIQLHYGVGAEILEQIIDDRDLADAVRAEASDTSADVGDASVEASIIKFVNQILLDAYRDQSTDVHFEPFESCYRIRKRIDGMLYKVSIPESLRHFQQEIVSRIKIMADLNIAETRLPQDGRIKIRVGIDEVDLRVSILPLIHGESVDIRILQSRNAFVGLERLGMTHQNLDIFRRIARKTHGIVLVTGPTGSGKSTTLYSALAEMNTVGRKIITIEDPVEYQLTGVCQMQVKPKIGFDFAAGLRSILRHDPDVILVGEIRDFETAELALRASLTGHLVFSTLHTNNAPASITRLQDIGIDSYLLASSLEVVIAQRLVRVICGNCKREAAPDSAIKALVNANPADWDGTTLFEGAGCTECHKSGYRGRTVIQEGLELNDPIRRLIMQGAPANEIRTLALDAGMTALRTDGIEKVRGGITTLDEVLRITGDESV